MIYTAATINDAINTIASQGGGYVDLLPATYTVDQPVILRPGVFVRGHRTATTLQAVPGYTGAIVTNEAPTTGQNFSRDHCLSGVTILGSGRNGTSVGLSLSRLAEAIYDEVRITQCGIGVVVNDGILNTFRHLKAYDNGIGFWAKNRANLTSVSHSRIQASNAENIIIEGPNTFSVSLIGTGIESSGLVGSASPGLLVESGVKGLAIVDCHFESNRNGSGGQMVIRNSTVANGASAVSLRGGWFSCAGKSRYAIEVQDCHSLHAEGYTTAGHQRTHYLSSKARVCLLPGGLSDINTGGALYEGGGIPYFLTYNGTIQIPAGVELTGQGGGYIRKTTPGNLAVSSVAGASVYVNGQRFPG